MFVIVILQHQNQSKIHIKMKKLLSLIIAVMMLSFQAIAQESETTTSSQQIFLEHTTRNLTYERPRAPMRVNIEAFYNAESHTIDISYDGEANGEVFLYLNDDIIGYDSSINTSIQIPYVSGLYRIEIVSDTWIAQGYIQL